jgi:hypothetical protein
MKLDCREISISDEELGCQVNFSENEDLGSKTENMSFKEIIESIGRYLLLQRSYPEDDLERDYYYFVTHDENLCGVLENFEIVLSRKSFELKFDSEIIEISINPTNKEYTELKRVLPIIINKRGRLIINE